MSLHLTNQNLNINTLTGYIIKLNMLNVLQCKRQNGLSRNFMSLRSDREVDPRQVEFIHRIDYFLVFI